MIQSDTFFCFQMIRDELKQGNSEAHIMDSLRAQYGESITYSPSFDLQTAALWLAPVSWAVGRIFVAVLVVFSQATAMYC